MSRTVHVSLDEQGLEGQWIELRDPKFLSKRTVERWQKEFTAPDAESEKLLREFVASWHLIDIDNGTELNSPTADSMDGIPLVVFQVLNERIGQLFRGTVAAGRSDSGNDGLAHGDTRDAPAAP